MFETLVESGDRRPAPSRAGAMALALHVLVVTFAVQRTQTVPRETPRPIPIDVILSEENPTPTRSAAGSTTSEDPALPAPAPNPIVSTDPGPIGPVTLDSISPISLGSDLRRSIMDDARRTGFSPGTGTPGVPGLNGILLAGEVDQPVQVLQAASPRYPRAQEAAGTPGRVVLQFVVDTSGTAEPASVRILSATDSAFAASSREAIGATRFAPARALGRKVRQLVRQSIDFTVKQ